MSEEREPPDRGSGHDPDWDELPIRSGESGDDKAKDPDGTTPSGKGRNLSLFDDEVADEPLPSPSVPAIATPTGSRRDSAPEPELPGGPEELWEPEELPLEAEEEPARESAKEAAGPATAPPLAERALATLADCIIHTAVLSIVVIAMISMGLEPTPGVWPGVVVFLLIFSFLYTTVPLAFWGQTPGMAWRGLRATDHADRTLSFVQTGMRWLGWVATVALLGIPGLLGLGGRTLADRISRSSTTIATS